MKIREYINEYYQCLDALYNHETNHVTDNSKKVKKNSIFVVIDNGFSYIDEAISKGAKSIILSKNLEKNINLKERINYIFVDQPKADLARLLKIFYLNKYKKLPVMIAVTGTAGKTTMSSLIYQVIKKIGYDVLLIGSNGNYSYYSSLETFYETKNTTPSISVIYDLMSSNELSYDYVIIEVSSQGVVEGRVLGIEFDYTVITNFYKEHLEYHLSLSEYRNAKARILNNTKKAIIINREMNSFNFFNNLNAVRKITYGVEKGDFRLVKIEDEELFLIKNCDRTFLINKRLEGDFNLENVVGAFSLLMQLNFNEVDLINAINSIEPIVGRMNLVYDKDKKIYVDYAHTIIGVEEVLKYFHEHKKARIISVIGCGGERDKLRRPVIGRVVTTYSDLVIFTEDNSRSESTKDIISEIVSGVEKSNYFVEEDRFKAIKLACDISKMNDIVLILGKGNESKLENKQNVIHFNDIETVKLIMEGK